MQSTNSVMHKAARHAMLTSSAGFQLEGLEDCHDASRSAP